MFYCMMFIVILFTDLRRPLHFAAVKAQELNFERVNPLNLRTVGLFSCDVLFNLSIFVNEVAFEIIEPHHLAQLRLKGLKANWLVQTSCNLNNTNEKHDFLCVKYSIPHEQVRCKLTNKLFL